MRRHTRSRRTPSVTGRPANGLRPLTPLALMEAIARRLARGRGGHRGGGDHDQHLPRTAGGAEERDRLLQPSRLGARLGPRLRHRGQARLARAPRACTAGRWCGALWHPGIVDRGTRTNPRDLRHLQQRTVPDPQGRGSRSELASRPARASSSGWTSSIPRSTTWPWRSPLA